MLFTFPSRYLSTIGLLEVFSLTGWSRQIQTGFHVSRLTQDTVTTTPSYVYGAITRYGPTFQMVLLRCHIRVVALQPHYCRNNNGLGYFHFARHYSGNHFCFLFLPLLRCFSSRGSLPFLGNWPSASWVAPFGNLRIKGYLHLPEAYRSLSRPSSPPRA